MKQLFTAIILITILLSACTPASTPVPTPTLTPAATATPVSTSTATVLPATTTPTSIPTYNPTITLTPTQSINLNDAKLLPVCVEGGKVDPKKCPWVSNSDFINKAFLQERALIQLNMDRLTGPTIMDPNSEFKVYSDHSEDLITTQSPVSLLNIYTIVEQGNSNAVISTIAWVNHDGLVVPLHLSQIGNDPSTIAKALAGGKYSFDMRVYDIYSNSAYQNLKEVDTSKYYDAFTERFIINGNYPRFQRMLKALLMTGDADPGLSQFPIPGGIREPGKDDKTLGFMKPSTADRINIVQ